MCLLESPGVGGSNNRPIEAELSLLGLQLSSKIPDVVLKSGSCFQDSQNFGVDEDHLGQLGVT